MHYGVYQFPKLTGEHVLLAFLIYGDTEIVLKVVYVNFELRYTWSKEDKKLHAITNVNELSLQYIYIMQKYHSLDGYV